ESRPIIPLTPEEFEVVEEKSEQPPLNQFTADFGSWSSPFDEETERVERMIRETGRATIQDDAEQPPQARIEQLQEPNVYDGETGYYQEPSHQDRIYNVPRGGRVTVSSSRFERYSRTP